jgi:NADH:ubiquinone oxidoreductase subunit 2 (subunit N)
LFFIVYFIGTIAGLYEKVIMRMVAFSSIANFGFIVLGLCLSSIDGFIVVVFYFLVYSLGLILLFFILSVAKHEGS